MIKIIIGAIVGFVGGYVLCCKNKEKELKSPTGEPYSLLYQQTQAENNKLRNLVKQGNSQIDELNTKVKSLTKVIREKEDLAEDQIDDIDSLKNTIQRLQNENSTLKEQANEYKMLYKASLDEIEHLKNKL